MSQLSIAGLPLPSKGYRIDRDFRGNVDKATFETPTFSRGEDEARAKGLRRPSTLQSGLIDVQHARRLADQLAISGETGENPESPASSVYMRDQRRRIVGALWQLVEG